MIDGNYVEHIVSAGESIKKIAKIHNVSSKEILIIMRFIKISIINYYIFLSRKIIKIID